MTDDLVEQEAIRIHDKSEADQARIWKRRGHHGPYVIMKWEDIAEGFYKERVRRVALKNLEAIEPKPKKKKVTKKKNAKVHR